MTNIYYYVQTSMFATAAFLATGGAIWSRSGYRFLWALLAVVLTGLWGFWALWGRSFIRAFSVNYEDKRNAAESWLSNHALHEDGCHKQYGKRCNCGQSEVLELVRRSV